MSELKPCKFCGNKPVSYGINLSKKGVTLPAWCIECSEDEEQEIFPYADHRISVYGGSKEEAEERWNFVNSFPIGNLK